MEADRTNTWTKRHVFGVWIWVIVALLFKGLSYRNTTITRERGSPLSLTPITERR